MKKLFLVCSLVTSLMGFVTINANEDRESRSNDSERVSSDSRQNGESRDQNNRSHENSDRHHRHPDDDAGSRFVITGDPYTVVHK